ncbi:MAG: lactonase family protein [Bacteroidetes bacterium]|nr:lactonase family protein [Bacteroidota bacterium]MBS1972739.1 lactonase family protein [Bacteroidota bacterium]
MKFFFLLPALFFANKNFSQEYYLFIGTYTNGPSLGIYVYNFNAANNSFQPVDSIASKNPSYMAISPDGKYVYAVNENGADKPGEVSAYTFDKSTGKISFLNKQQSGGTDPCYLSENKNSKWLMVANYSSGTISAIPVNIDGSIGSIAEIIQHVGKSIDPERQEKAHAHSAIFSPDEHYLLCADLGMDKETVYKFDPNNPGRPLTGAKDSSVDVTPGSGPRHIAFSPGKPNVYLIEELSGTIDAFHFINGSLKQFQRISALPENFQGQAGSADIHITPNGRFLYASNRGDANNIAIFSIDPKNSKLKLKGFQDVLGKHPRNFVIDPTGHFLLVANRDTDNIVIFSIDQKTGLLTDTGKQLLISNPVCLKLLKK